MKRITKVFLVVAIAFGGIQTAVAVTFTETFGNNTGLGLGINEHNSDLFPTSSVGTSSSFLYSDLPLFQGSGNPQNGLTDTWVFGTKTFNLSLLSLSTEYVVNSVFLEISSGGHGLGEPSSLFLLNGNNNQAYSTSLSDGDGVGPRNPGNEPSPTYNALFLDTFDLTSFLGDARGGFLGVTITPGGGNLDGWALDYARLVYNVSARDIDVTPPSETAPVPLPAAAWLFITGLLSLVGFSGRKRKV